MTKDFYIYAKPPKREWVKLTDDEVLKIVQGHKLNVGNWQRNGESVARAIEAKLKELNA